MNYNDKYPQVVQEVWYRFSIPMGRRGQVVDFPDPEPEPGLTYCGRVYTCDACRQVTTGWRVSSEAKEIQEAPCCSEECRDKLLGIVRGTGLRLYINSQEVEAFEDASFEVLPDVDAVTIDLTASPCDATKEPYGPTDSISDAAAEPDPGGCASSTQPQGPAEPPRE